MPNCFPKQSQKFTLSPILYKFLLLFNLSEFRHFQTFSFASVMGLRQQFCFNLHLMRFRLNIFSESYFLFYERPIFVFTYLLPFVFFQLICRCFKPILNMNLWSVLCATFFLSICILFVFFSLSILPTEVLNFYCQTLIFFFMICGCVSKIIFSSS